MDNWELRDDFKCEYAKSNKSTCRQCKEKIEQDEIRLGKLERATTFDGEIYEWHHLSCFVVRHGSRVKSSEDIKGLSDLRWKDQEDLRKTFDVSSPPDTTTYDSSEEDDDDEDEGGTYGVFVEYASSGRAACKTCFVNIAHKQLRVGVRTYDSANGYDSTSFYHLSCYSVPSSITSIYQVSGVKSLNQDDRTAVENLFDESLRAVNAKRKEMDEEKDGAAIKRRKANESAKEKSERLWEIKTRLKEYNTTELKAMLFFNNQDHQAGHTELINRIADGEVNGALPLCRKCKSGHLVYDTGIIKCTGHQSAWSGCTFTCGPDEIARGSWKECPNGTKLADLIDKMNYTLSKSNPSSSFTASSETLFKDVVASLVGDVPDEVADIIVRQGGQVTATVSSLTTHLIATYEEVAKESRVTKVATAIQLNIPIVSQAFVYLAVKEKCLRSQPRFILWEGGAAVKINEERPLIKQKDISYEEHKGGEGERKKLVVPKTDAKSEVPNGSILVDKEDVYAVTLNLSDITRGQTGLNSFYVMQIIHSADLSTFTLFRKWGRVGQEGTATEAEFTSKRDAIDEFKRIFYEKTRNSFNDFLTNKFTKQPGKFYPVELGEDETPDEARIKRAKEVLTKQTLDPRVVALVKLLFNPDMFTEQMEQLKIDTKKMPVGRLSKAQIAKGVAVLEEIESELSNPKPDADFLVDASNRFYTIIPHDFGFDKPSVIASAAILQKRYELLEILGDIEIAARMLDEEDQAIDKISQQYAQLKNKIDVVEPSSEEFKRIATYWENTKQGNGIHIEEVFKLRREGESDLFKAHNKLQGRKLLWHGSSVAVFAAILSGGLKIMPHAGGRVGAGLYFADMISKSAGYIGYHESTGLVLLNEVALGNINRIQHDDHTLRKPPWGFDSVLAEGQCMPNPSGDYMDYSLSESGHPVAVPQSEPHDTGVAGSFYHNEYLIYDQTQVSMRYLIKIGLGDGDEDD